VPREREGHQNLEHESGGEAAVAGRCEHDQQSGEGAEEGHCDHRRGDQSREDAVTAADRLTQAVPEQRQATERDCDRAERGAGHDRVAAYGEQRV
jgi:hypothetical protein